MKLNGSHQNKMKSGIEYDELLHGQQKAAEELYDSELLSCSDEEFLESLKSDAEKAGQGIKTDIRLHSVDNDMERTRPFDLYIPKYAITGGCRSHWRW